MTIRGSRSNPRARSSWLLVIVGVGLALVAAACAPAPGGGPVTTTTDLPTDAPFTVVVVGDSEPRMRGNTDAEVAAYVRNIASYRTDRVAHFEFGDGAHRIDPRLVVLAGDISADRGTSVAADLPLWQPLYDNGIAFVAGFGNHDWEPAIWSDGSAGYSLAGHLSNQNTAAFTRETYRRSAQLTDRFRYREVTPTSTHGPTTFHANFRGVDIVNFNTFLYQPSYRYPEGWPLSCNLAGGGAGCQTFVSAETQIDRMSDLFDPVNTATALFVQHFPLSTADSWWSDHGASGTTVAQKQERLLALMAEFDHAALFAGHNHSPLRATHPFAGRTFEEYVAPYFGGDNGPDPTRGGGFLALLVSPTAGILEVATVTGGGDASTVRVDGPT